MKPRILIVDDDKSTASVFQEFLADEGYNSKAAFDAKSAIKQFGNGGFDLIIMDYKLPNYDGVTLYEQFKTKNASLKVIFLTGYNLKEKSKVKENKECFILEKPARPREILALIKKMF